MMAALLFAQQGQAYNAGMDYDRDGKPDSLIYNIENDGLRIVYKFSYYDNRKMSYFFEKPDECSSMQLYPLPHTSRIAVDGSRRLDGCGAAGPRGNYGVDEQGMILRSMD